MKITKELIDAFAEGEVEYDCSLSTLTRYSSTVNDCTLCASIIGCSNDKSFHVTITYDGSQVHVVNTDECKYAYYVLSRKYEEQKNNNRDNLIKTITEKVLGE